MTLRQPKRRTSEHRLHRGRRRCVAQNGPALLNTAVNTGIRSLHGKHQSKTRDGSHYFCTKQRSTSTDSLASEPQTQRLSGAHDAALNSNRSSRFPHRHHPSSFSRLQLRSPKLLRREIKREALCTTKRSR